MNRAKDMSDDALFSLVAMLAERCVNHGHSIATAESCTGGWIGKCLTDMAGSSTWYFGGWITYDNRAKIQMLGVDSTMIDAHGAVSEAVVSAMALAAKEKSGASLSVAVSGVAGPSGGTPEKPVGTVYLACASAAGVAIKKMRYQGDRERIRKSAVMTSLQMLLDVA